MNRRKIFGIGLSRTGTTSLTKALDRLGIRCKHYPHDALTKAELWTENSRLSILEQYDAITDISIVPFYQTLDHLYPGSRFILTVREEGAWLASMDKHFRSLRESPLMQKADYRSFTEAICERVYGGMTFNSQRLIAKLHEHTAAVQRFFSERSGDLLMMNITEGGGWDTLCPFLDLKVPDSPFPHANDRSEQKIWDENVAAFMKAWGDLEVDPERVFLLDDGRLSTYVAVARSQGLYWDERGRFSDRPGSDSRACDLLLEMQAKGAEAIVIAWPAFWWLKTYPTFARVLRKHFFAVLENQAVAVYRLKGSLTER